MRRGRWWRWPCILAVLFVGITFVASHYAITHAGGARDADRQTVIAQVARTIYGELDPLLPLPGVHRAAAVPRREHLVHRVPATGGRPRRGRLLPAPVRVPWRPPRVLDGHRHARRHRRDAGVPGRRPTHALIPLYAVGVFIDFTISQLGMVRHWLRERPPGWRGASRSTRSGCVADGRRGGGRDQREVIDGAWLVVLLIPVLVGSMLFIRRQYDAQTTELHVREDQVVPGPAPGAARRRPGERHQPGRWSRR